MTDTGSSTRLGHVPAVSVILPAFNALATLPDAIASVQAQTFADWELVAIDDGSTDGTDTWLQALARVESRLRVLTQPHLGIVAALNAGIAAARGPCLARMDADDRCLPERLAEQVGLLRARSDLGMVGTQVAYDGDRALHGGYVRHVDWLNSLTSPDEIALARFIECPVAHPTLLFRRECVDRFGGYRAGDFPEDYELCLRWLDAGVRIANVPKPLLRWRDRPERLSRTDPRYRPEAFFRLKASFLASWLERQVDRRRPILVWGAGRLTRRRAGYLEAAGCAVAGFVDIDPRKQGRRRDGRTVWAPDHLPPPEEVFVVGYVANRGARDLQRAFLGQRGFQEGRDCLFAA